MTRSTIVSVSVAVAESATTGVFGSGTVGVPKNRPRRAGAPIRRRAPGGRPGGTAETATATCAVTHCSLLVQVMLAGLIEVTAAKAASTEATLIEVPLVPAPVRFPNPDGGVTVCVVPALLSRPRKMTLS